MSRNGVALIYKLNSLQYSNIYANCLIKACLCLIVFRNLFLQLVGFRYIVVSFF